MKSTVKRFDHGRDFGFIKNPQPDGKDIFVHYSEISGKGYRFLKIGEEVEFEIRQTEKGPQAINVRMVRTSEEAEFSSAPATYLDDTAAVQGVVAPLIKP